MKIYCETCEGLGMIYQADYDGADYMGDESMDCADCQGKGYTEPPETQRLLEIGRATVEAFEQMSVSFDWYDNYDDNLYKCVGDAEMLLKWHKEMEAKG